MPFYYKTVKEYILIAIGSALAAIGVSVFLAPGHIAAGGASGLGILIREMMGIPVSASVLVINLIMFAFGFKLMKMSVLFKTIAGTVMLSLFIEMFSKIRPFTPDVLMSAVYGGVLVGGGTGLVVMCNASTGGSDFAALLLKRFFPAVSVAKLILFIDLAVVIASGFVFSDQTLLLYAILSLFITAKIAEAIIEGVNFSKLVFIISEKRDEISQYIINELKRGVTSFEARGEYSKKEKTVIMSAISAKQFPSLREYVRGRDENAFIILSDARSVFGEGFNIE